MDRYIRKEAHAMHVQIHGIVSLLRPEKGVMVALSSTVWPADVPEIVGAAFPPAAVLSI